MASAPDFLFLPLRFYFHKRVIDRYGKKMFTFKIFIFFGALSLDTYLFWLNNKPKGIFTFMFNERERYLQKGKAEPITGDDNSQTTSLFITLLIL